MKSWADALSAVIRESVEKPPKDFKTAAQIAKELGTKAGMARRLIRQLGSKVEVREYRIQSGKRIMKVPHYRLR